MTFVPFFSGDSCGNHYGGGGGGGELTSEIRAKKQEGKVYLARIVVCSLQAISPTRRQRIPLIINCYCYYYYHYFNDHFLLKLFYYCH